MGRWLQDFADGRAEDRDLLGGKGANLAEMTRLGLPVPPGFTVTTAACRASMVDGELPDGLLDEVHEAVVRLEEARGQRFGGGDDPLLLSVRSGAAVSMPGMMDTVLDLGLNPSTVKGLEAASGDARFAMDSWRRLTEMFAKVVLGVPAAVLDDVRVDLLASEGAADASALDADGAARLVMAYRHAIVDHTGEPFPDDPHEQLDRAVEAVFRSWDGRRARDYRRLTGVSDDLGTAVNVQAMVFGNLGPDSGSGVVFTRDPATGAPVPYGDVLLGAQGEDVVAGVRATEPYAALADHLPEVAVELAAALDLLEARWRDLCDVEFTVERGRLWVLQTRVGKRSAAAAVRIATDLVHEGVLSPPEAVRRVQPEQLDLLLHPRFDPSAERKVLTTGLAASPGAAAGAVVLTADEAERRGALGEDVLLVRDETSPDDLHGIVAARGILTSRGGLVSHAAVVARGLGVPAVCGAAEIEFDRDGTGFRVGGIHVREGDLLSLDGTSGEVVLGAVPVVAPTVVPELDELLGWADRIRVLGVRTNADTAGDARRARELGAEGIGLCRTEHMFLGDRLPVLQAVLLAEDQGERAEALDRLHDAQRDDLTELLEAMDGLPVTVRLLDPPLHEFLPDVEELAVAEAAGMLDDAGRHLLEAARPLQEHDPMLGIRGVRLAVLQPDLLRMQARALAEAVLARLAAGGDPRVQVMVPLVVAPAEFAHVADIVRAEIAAVADAAGTELGMAVGTMVETPRAALLAGELAIAADFLSFGTNDLTQLTFGFSRDDVEARLLPRYLELGLLPADPFGTLDVDGVGRLVADAVTAARATDPTIEIGVCGEHGGDPASIVFLAGVGLDYVSCSPPRVPVARLAAAHAVLDAAD
jgi:pyruvate,orthophosphate dikinase